MSFIEQSIGDGFTQVIGDQTLIGVIFLGFFTAFVLMQGTRLDAKVAIMVPVSILALVFIPWLGVMLALVLGMLLYAGIMKLISK